MTLTSHATVPAPVPSSSRDRRSCAHAGPAVRQHWGTPLTFATLEPAGLLHPSAADIGADGPALETVPPGEIIADLESARAQFRASFDTLAAAHAPGRTPPAGGVEIDVQIWRHGYHRPPAGHPADLVAWWFLDAGPAAEHTESGALTLADPRAGSPPAAMPGRPWGRHLMIRPVPGAHVAVPGWLTASVVPLERGRHVLVAFAASVR